MKRLLGIGVLFLLSTISLYAAKNSQTVSLPAAVQVGSTTLPAGHCQVSWTGTGSDAQVTITTEGKKTVTVPAQIVDQKLGRTGVLTIDVKGVSYLQEIQLNNLKIVVKDAPREGN